MMEKTIPTPTPTPTTSESCEQNAQRVQVEDVSSTRVSYTIPFSSLATTYERLTASSKHSDKKGLLQRFFERFRKVGGVGEDLFSVLRLLVPQVDRERQTYGMKETLLARFYVELLGISPESDDGKRLLFWKRPGGTVNSSAGDFGQAVEQSLKNRCCNSGSLSIGALNSALDDLSSALDRRAKLNALKRLVRKTTAGEQKWIVRIILRELKIGLSEAGVLKALHPKAFELFQLTSSIRTVCEELTEEHSTHEKERLSLIGKLQLFYPAKPMLAARRDLDYVGRMLSQKQQLAIEIKYDGERIQIHKSDCVIKIFSRKSNDVTPLYGGELIPTLLKAITANRCIIDGELLVWNNSLHRFDPFGSNKTAAIESQRYHSAGSQPRPGEERWLCFVAFDILFFEDSSLLEVPLQTRSTILAQAVKVKPKKIELVKQQLFNTLAGLSQALDKAIQDREEGLMVKSLDGMYQPGRRSDCWLKVKPEYFDGLATDLDLLILGGYYGTGIGRRGGTVSHFLLGVRATENTTESPVNPSSSSPPSSSLSPSSQTNSPPIYYSFCKVGSGYSDQELKALQRQLEKSWRVYEIENPPRWLKLAPSFKEKPDLYIPPHLSCVLQLKAAQIVVSDRFRVGYTLRFPRVMKIRSDKQWEDATDLAELQSIISISSSPSSSVVEHKKSVLRKREHRESSNLSDDSDDEGDADNFMQEKRSQTLGRHTNHRVLSVAPHFQAAELSGSHRESRLFESLEFCVLNTVCKSKRPVSPTSPLHSSSGIAGPGTCEGGSEEGPQTLRSKADMETLLFKNGASIVQHPTEKTFCLIAGELTVKVKILVDTNKYDIAFPKWVEDCLQSGLLIPFQPKYMLHLSEATKKKVRTEFDEFGDGFFSPSSPESLRDIFAQINPIKPLIEPLSSLDFQNLFPAKECWWRLFGNCVFHIVQPSKHAYLLPFTRHLINFYGGHIEEVMKRNVSHVIIPPCLEKKYVVLWWSKYQEFERICEGKDRTSPSFVAPDWISQSASNKLLLSEADFLPPTISVLKGGNSTNNP